MAKKEPLKKAAQDSEGGLLWTWKGQGEVKHTVHWSKSGVTLWGVWFDETLLRTEEPWFLVKARGEVQENIRHFRNAGMDMIHANRALLSAGIMPDQHQDTTYCNCGRCTSIGERTA